MVVNNQKLLLWLGFASIILLPNHDIFNYLFKGTPLFIWKQALAFMLLVTSIQYASRMANSLIGSSSVRKLGSILIYLIVFAALLGLANGLSLIRVAYGSIAYVGFMGMMVFASLVVQRKMLHTVLNTFVFLGLFIGCGLIFDYFTSYLSFLPRAADLSITEQLDGGHLRRVGFFLGSVNVGFPFLSFCLVAAALVLKKRRNSAALLRYSSLLLVLILGTYLTGSRSSIMLLISFAMILTVLAFKGLSLSKKFQFFIYAAAALPFVMTYASSFVFQADMLMARYSNALDQSALGNDLRYVVWQEGLALFQDAKLYVVGNGVGSSLAMIQDGFTSTGHYESSFFQSFSEAGLAGLVIRYFPGVYCIWLLIFRGCRISFVEKSLLLWLVFYVVSVSGAPNAAAYHTQMTYFFVVGLSLHVAYVRIYVYGLSAGGRLVNSNRWKASVI
ncbi:O-antigen ligase family protein [Thiocapsa rosea]|nr:O-antigen ligase family protein [Thiocapsa rosea]